MLGDIYIPWLSNDMKIAVRKNHLRRQFFSESPDHVKKRRHNVL